MKRGVRMKRYPLMPADLYLPKGDFEHWAVVACDQFTSQPEYWNAVERKVGENPSALRITLPEIYLSENVSDRIEDINCEMERYLRDDVLARKENAMIYVERQISNGCIRRGVVGVVDLEDYDYRSSSQTAIRATEKTVLERIPPRVQIRKNALLESPHALLMIDDVQKTVIEPLERMKGRFEVAYDFDLMMDGGHITGYYMDKEAQEAVGKALSALNREGKMLFAVGDGNHSLAAAKSCYEANPTPLSRYALVETVNLQDDAIVFEPIYRVVFHADAATLMAELKKTCGEPEKSNGHRFVCLTREGQEVIYLKPTSELPVGTLQNFLDEYLAKNPQITVDYIHGEEVVAQLCRQENTIGFLFEGMQKDALFPAVEKDGSLPRKTFSMGHANDKRYYLECRRVR